jgi:predicted pyridoxine 5'-phosphate oxidase superfamily flavin-nucleotide-binding protein
MGVLTDQMQRLVSIQRLGYIATVCPDGTPNLSPKGTLHVWDDEHLVFADIRSPGTIRNLRQNPAIEINVVDPLARKGYRFKGTATVHASGDPRFAELAAFFRERGTTSPIRAVVLVQVTRALLVTSPAYDTGATEEELRARWSAYYAAQPSGDPRD